MDAGGREKGEDESADLGGKRRLFSGRVESQAWLWHTALPVFIPSTLLWLLTSFKASNEPTSSLALSLPDVFGSPLSSPSSSPSSIQYLLPLAVSSWVFLPSLFLSSALSGLFSSLPVAQRGVGSGQGLQVSMVILCVLMSLVLTVCS